MTNTFMSAPLSVIGARTTVMTLVLKRGQPVTLDLTARGVPADARILRMGYTAYGEHPLFPLQVATEQPPPPWFTRQITLYPDALGHPTESSELSVFVTWLPAEDAADVSREQLIQAFNAYTRGDYADVGYNQCIIPANTAVEVALGGLMTRWLGAYASTENVKHFLKDGATYADQLKVLMPVMATAVGGLPLPEEIRGQLSRLNTLRNEIAHGGMPRRVITKDEAATCMCAAFFGVEYLRILGERLPS